MKDDPFKVTDPSCVSLARSAAEALDAVFPSWAPDPAYINGRTMRITAGALRRLADEMREWREP